MTLLFIYSVLSSGLAMLGCWLEMDRPSGWRMAWLPALLGFMAVSATLFLGGPNVGLLGAPVFFGFTAALLVSIGGAIGAWSRNRVELKRSVTRVGIFVFLFVFFGLVYLSLTSMS